MIDSAKQIKSFNEATHAYNIWVGAVRSGKSHVSRDRLLYDLKNGPPGEAMIIGVNRTSVQRNILNPMYEKLGFPPPSEKASHDILYGRKVWFVGAPDVGAVPAIQGSTLALAYVDEATNLPEPFWLMLISRLSVPGAKLLATCNPEGPSHWLKKDFIDNDKLDLVHWNFCLDDNPLLTDTFKDQLRASYYGLWYNRYILGEWSLTHGAIYDCFDNFNVSFKEFEPPNYYIVGIDYGTSCPCAAVLCAVSPKRWPQIVVEDEYYYDPERVGRSKTDVELVRDIQSFIGYKNITAIYVDPSAASLKLSLRQADLPVLDAQNDVLLGIKTCTKFIGGKNMIIKNHCKTLINQIQSYAWDPKSAAKGEDKPLKKDDHICVTKDTTICIEGNTLSIDKLLENKTTNKKVKTFDGSKFIYSEFINLKKTGEDKKIFKLTLENGKFLRATDDHKVLTKRGFVEIRNLLPSDYVLCMEENEGKYSKVQSIEEDGREDVYCLNVPETGNFVANGIVIKNCDALRYAICTAFPTGEFGHQDDHLSYEQLRRKTFGGDSLIDSFNQEIIPF